MDEIALRKLLDDLRAGAVDPDEAVSRLRRLPYAELGFAKVDHHRSLRQTTGEAVYGPGKTPQQCAEIISELLAGSGGPVLLTRANPEQVSAALDANPGGTPVVGSDVPNALATVVWRPAGPREDRVLVVTAGTADLPVAKECLAVLRAYGVEPKLLADCGVAGVHRLLGNLDDLVGTDVVVVVAGMEGALASLVGGITAAPVIAVPTSAGYGAGLEGVTALLGMLASCAAGLTVVGIDNGFGAACAVLRMLGIRARAAAAGGHEP